MAALVGLGIAFGMPTLSGLVAYALGKANGRY